MRFDDLDSKMRVYETSHDHCVLPGLQIVARLDGRSFTRLTKERCNFERPFDERFRDAIVATTEHLMGCGFDVRFGYTQSDEISLLFARDEASFGRKLRKLNSVLAGEASAFLSMRLGEHACFDCRVSQLPADQLVVDYFRWRQQDAHRNALNAHCYWLLRGEEEGAAKQRLRANASARGVAEGRSKADCLLRVQKESASKATTKLSGLTVANKNELLFARGINFDALPSWQKRGTGLLWETYEKAAENPITGEAVTAQRRRLRVDYELPLKDAYSAYLRELLAQP